MEKVTVFSTEILNTNLVADLEDLLKKAKEGELVSLAYVGETRKGGYVSGWALSYRTSIYTTIGLLVRLVNTLGEECKEIPINQQ